jgi:hypothetical protein
MRNVSNEILAGYYPTLIETIIELKIYANKLIAENRG